MSRTKDHEIILKCTVPGVKQMSKEIVGWEKEHRWLPFQFKHAFQKCPVADFKEVVLALFGRGLIHNGGLRKLKVFEKALGDS